MQKKKKEEDELRKKSEEELWRKRKEEEEANRKADLARKDPELKFIEPDEKFYVKFRKLENDFAPTRSMYF